MYSKEEFIQKQTELDHEMAKIWENPFLDGVTDYDNYIKAPKKILWILKEPNNSGENSRKGGNQREYNIDPRDYKYWKQTYPNIMRASYGILSKLKNYSEIPPIDMEQCLIKDKNDDEEYFVLDEIAIINVKKSGGGSATDKKSLEMEYKREGVKEFLFKQIEFINPDIIINAHGVYDFYYDQTFNEELEGSLSTGFSGNYVQSSINNNRLIILTKHPNNRDTTAEDYCNNILEVVNSWNKEDEPPNGFFPNRPERINQYTKEECETLTKEQLTELFLDSQKIIEHSLKIISLQEETYDIYMKMLNMIGGAFGITNGKRPYCT